MSRLKKTKYSKSTFEVLTAEEQAEMRTRPRLVEKTSFRAKLNEWFMPTSLLLGFTLAFYLLQVTLSVGWSNPFALLSRSLGVTLENMDNATSFFVEASAAILGIVITVVAIVLQLAAQRYGARLVDLFLADSINRIYFFYMVSALLYAIMTAFSPKEGFFPQYAIETLLFGTLVEIALLAPYFLYMFRFLTPTNLLSAIQESNQEAMKKACAATNQTELRKLQLESGRTIEQVTDTALSATSQMDRNLGLMAINQIREIGMDYLEMKNKLPEEWFAIGPEMFIGISSEFYKEICEKKLWFEAKAFMDMELIYKSSIRTMPDAVSAIAYNIRVLGLEAMKIKDDDLLDLVVQFLNTFIRISLNEKNVRAIFNLFYQYRLLAEEIFIYNPEMSQKILFYFKYYGETCLQQGLFFVMYTAAYDMETMVAAAFDREATNIKELLLIFLGLEDNVDRKKDVFAFTGIRKAQLILATYFYSKGDRELIQLILNDLKSETVEQLTAWRDGLLAVQSRKFWEVTDRGVNLEYIDLEQKKQLKLFYNEFILAHADQFKSS